MMAMSGPGAPTGLATVMTYQAPLARPEKLKRLFWSQTVRLTKAE
jgi:hypothetical protein